MQCNWADHICNADDVTLYIDTFDIETQFLCKLLKLQNKINQLPPGTVTINL